MPRVTAAATPSSGRRRSPASSPATTACSGRWRMGPGRFGTGRFAPRFRWTERTGGGRKRRQTTRGGEMGRRDVIAALAGAAVVVVFAGGVAWAAIPDAGGVLN